MSLNKIVLAADSKHRFDVQFRTITTDPAATAVATPGTTLSLGVNALAVNTAGTAIVESNSVQIGVGTNANVRTTGATNNTGVGYLALDALTIGANNTADGKSSLAALTTGTHNTGVGVSSLAAVTTTSDSTAVGYQALAANTAANNTAFGSGALVLNTSGVTNDAFGKGALPANLTGARNVAVGFGSGTLITGDDNTLIGNAAGNGFAHTTSTFLGSGTDGDAIRANSTAIGYNSIVTADNAVMVGGTGVTSVLFANSGVGAVSLGSAAAPLSTVYSLQSSITSKLLTPATRAATNITLTGAEMAGGFFSQSGAIGAGTVTFPTGTVFKAAFTAASLPPIGSYFPLLYVNASNGAQTLTTTAAAPADSMTVSATGCAAVVSAASSRTLMLLRVSDVAFTVFG